MRLLIESTGATHTHSQGTDTVTTNSPAGSTPTPEERSRLGPELERARAITLSIPTAAESIAAGLVVPGTSTPTAGRELYDPGNSGLTTFDLERPLAWIFADDSAEAPVIGLLYGVIGADAPEGFAGADDGWHLHLRECVVEQSGGGSFAIPLDDVTTGADCALVSGQPRPAPHWMLRVWVVPGWENPSGTFAHGHPAAGLNQ